MLEKWKNMWTKGLKGTLNYILKEIVIIYCVVGK